MTRVPILLVALGEDASREALHELSLEPLHTTSQGSVWISHGPVQNTLAALRRLLQRGAVRSAALLPEVPPRDRLWLVIEWRGRLVVAEEYLPVLEEQGGWSVESRNERHDLLILSPGEMRGKVRKVESPEGYQSSLFSAEPVVAHLRMAELERGPKGWRQWFGELAEPDVGGAVALLALSGARSHSGEVLLRNPAALGLQVAFDDVSALSTYCRRKKLEVVAHGGSWGNLERQATALEPDDSRDMQARQALLQAQRETRGASYYVLLEVEAIEDPEVVIPAGAIFEQSSLNGVQTLAAASQRKFQIDVGQFLPIAFPAWCLNRHLSPPAGQPVRPTPLIYPGGSGGQGMVWEDLEQHLMETSL